MSEPNAAQLAAFSVDAYDAAADLASRLPPGFVRLADLAGETGFGGLRAAAYFNQATGELVVAYCGSAELREVFTNLSAVTGTGETHLNHALAFAAEARAYAEKLTGAPLADAAVTLTGHGVGGGFASLVAVATGLSATTFNGIRIGGLMSAMQERFGSLAPDYASRITNYVDAQEASYTLPRGTTQIGKVVDVQTTAVSFSGQLHARVASDATGADVLDAVYDWLANRDEDRQRARRMLAALELRFCGVDLVDDAGQTIDAGSAAGATHVQQRIEQLNKLMQTDRADLVQSRTFDRLFIDGSDAGERQDASAFGDSDDLLVGAAGADQLAGGDGDDVLFGGDGNDIMSGGAGADELLGGTGSDLYRLDAGSRGDTVRDKSGSNRLVWDGAATANFFYEQSPGRWASADGRVVMALENGEYLLQHADGGQVKLDQFAERDYGIRLFSARTDPITSTTQQGDQTPGWDDDYLMGSPANNRIFGGFGADTIAGYGGDDYLSGGAGADYLLGDGDGIWGQDTLLGGAGSDIVLGDGGADRLFADEAVALATAIGATTTAALDERGDWLNGGQGDDIAVGSAAHDVLLGGGGADLLVGGAGNDHLLGDADYVPDDYDWTFAGKANGTPTTTRSTPA